LPDLPSGTVTFLFTDIEGSTRLLQTMGEDYVVVLTRHRRILRQAFARHGGVEFGSEGDSLYAAFRSAMAAVAAAVDAQAELEQGPIRVRMGMHTGEPFISEGEYIGLDVHKAARIASAGHGGQVVLSGETLGHLEYAVTVTDLGEHELKDFDEPVKLFQLGDQTFPPRRILPVWHYPVRKPPPRPRSARYPGSDA
jgi:class 3 adenylate cyclase